MDNLARKFDPAPASRTAYPPPALLRLKPLIRYTYADYLLWDDHIRWELIDGKVYMMAAPTGGHQGIVGELYYQLYGYLRGKTCRVFPAPYDVRPFAGPETAGGTLSDRDVVQPDLVVVCDRRKLRRRGCRGAPDLVVEALSPSNTKKVMDAKYELYRKAGVREYWIVDPENRVVKIHTLREGRYEPRVYTAGDGEAGVKVGVLENCVIDIAAVFAAGAAAEAGEPVSEGVE